MSSHWMWVGNCDNCDEYVESDIEDNWPDGWEKADDGCDYCPECSKLLDAPEEEEE